MSLSALLAMLQAMGINPASLAVGTIVGLIVAGVPTLKQWVVILEAKIRGYNSESLDAVAIPLLDAINGDLDKIKASNPDLQAVAGLIADGVLKVAVDPAHAKAILLEILKGLDSKIAKGLEPQN